MSTHLQLHDERSSIVAIARHETFHPRYGWLKKTFEAVFKQPAIFTTEQCHITLGVGKNMARSMRYWALAFKIVEEDTESKNRSKPLTITKFGEALFNDETGFDPYLETSDALWLLHWNLLKPPCLATTWHYMINHYAHNQVKAQDVLPEYESFLLQEFPDNKFAESSLTRDLNTFTRMYCLQPNAKFSEDSIDSPFTILNILEVGDRFQYRINGRRKENLSDEVLVACCLDFASGKEANSISLNHLCHEPSSPGRVFKIGVNQIEEAVEKMAIKNNSISMANTAGILQLSFDKDPAKISRNILKKFFKAKNA